ncbi:hypothetical protein SAMN02744102_00505 [Paenibacillus barengoltzii]|jgi:hypothetical protein|nr:hypothetical protein SAMN02744102_00505 [Paenibacillus barengoltzii]
MTGVGVIGVLPALLFLFYLVLAGLILYALILFIRLAHRGIEALDIYLRDKRGR